MSTLNRDLPGGFGTPMTPGVKMLLISNVAVFALTALVPRGPWGALELRPALVVHGAIWQLFTYLFLHADMGHIFFNMLSLWMFGRDVEATWGRNRFLTYYFTCGVGAGVCITIAGLLAGEGSIATIGASGAIFAVFLAYGMMFPNARIWIMMMFPVPAKYAVMIFGGIEFFGFIHNAGGPVSHIAHLGGLLVGFLYLRFYAGSTYRPYTGYRYGQRQQSAWQRFAAWFSIDRLRDAYEEWNRRRLRKKFEVYMKKRGGDDGPTIH